MLEAVHPEVTRRADTFGREFQQAAPFRHVQIEGFFQPDYLERLRAEFPGFDPRYARNEQGEIGNKAVVERIRGIGPAYAALDDLIQSQPFLDLVSTLTGIPDLLYDPWYFGGGTHENRHGQDLDAHVDFNRHPITGWHRRLNLIVYLNPEWDEAWGGCLDLHRDPRAADDEVRRIAPLDNRCVIFETNEISWHGFERIDLPQARRDLTRRSIALYFYTQERPVEELADSHSTIYVDRPLPPQITAGHVLTDEDVETLRGLLARRDQHNQRLYRDVERLTSLLDRANEALYAGWLGRVRHGAIRLLALARRRPT
jgi:hypothetical protein